MAHLELVADGPIPSALRA